MATVMLVEDEALVRALLQEALEEHGMPVEAAQDGEAAISLLEHTRPTLLLTDINLGRGPDGFEVSRRARIICPSVRVVYVSAREAHLAALGVPGSVMVPKPFDLCRLAARVRTWYDEALAQAVMGPSHLLPAA